MSIKYISTFIEMLLSHYTKNTLEAGCDEAGRGCLAGAVFAAAVILPAHYKNGLLNDSKKLNEATRNQLRKIIERDAIAFAVAKIDEQEIDKINILKASFKAMHQAIKKLKTKPELLLIDGNRFVTYENIPHICIVKGDGKYMSIAAASILAKTYRDDYMQKLNKKYPMYGWAKNKAYGTLQHRNAIKEFGICKHHRKTFMNLNNEKVLLF
jgi:ribonuclease HII